MRRSVGCLVLWYVADLVGEEEEGDGDMRGGAEVFAEEEDVATEGGDACCGIPLIAVYVGLLFWVVFP